MFYSTNQSHHWKLNQSDYKKRTNQIPHNKNEQPITVIVIIDFSYVSPVPKKHEDWEGTYTSPTFS